MQAFNNPQWKFRTLTVAGFVGAFWSLSLLQIV